MDIAKQKVLKVLDTAIDSAANIFRNSLKDQGHVLTGKLLRSIRGVVLDFKKILTLYVEMADYYEILDKGVSADRIPFNPGSGAESSRYISGLISFFRKRGLNNKRATSAAFATAFKHKLEGMPTRASRRFSVTKKRTGFVSDNIEKANKLVIELIDKKIDDALFGSFILELDKIYSNG